MIDKYHLKIVGVTAKSSKENNTDVLFYFQDKINPSLVDYIIVTTGLDYFDEIEEKAQRLGFKQEQIIPIIDLQTYDYMWKEYLENRGASTTYYLKIFLYLRRTVVEDYFIIHLEENLCHL